MTFKLFFFHSGKDYYMNIYTKESQWDEPTEPAEQKSNKVTCSHLLVKHKHSRRPQNWKGEEITRTKEEALELLQRKGFAFLKFLVNSVFYVPRRRWKNRYNVRVLPF